MRVVIAGGGNVGTYIAGELHRAGHDVLIVEVDPKRIRQAESAHEASKKQTLGAATDVRILHEVE